MPSHKGGVDKLEIYYILNGMLHWTKYILMLSVVYPFLFVFSFYFLGVVERFSRYAFNPVPIFGATLFLLPVVALTGMVIAAYAIIKARKLGKSVKIFSIVMLFNSLWLLWLIHWFWVSWKISAQAIM